MPSSYRDLFEVNLKYLDYVVEKTLVTHQYFKSASASGASVESEVRELLRRITPSRFRITHGYIVASAGFTSEPVVSPQVDVLIVDTLVPHSLWTIDETQGVELVPVESVVGIFEVKRTLDRRSLAAAVAHLRKIRDGVRIQKYSTTKYMPGGVEVGRSLRSPYSSNPLLGIVGVVADPWFGDAPTERAEELTAAVPGKGAGLELDLILSLDGTLVATGDPNGSSTFTYHTIRNPEVEYPWCEASRRVKREPRQALAFGLGFVLAYIQYTCGRVPDLAGYFFNDAIGDPSNRPRPEDPTVESGEPTLSEAAVDDLEP